MNTSHTLTGKRILVTGSRGFLGKKLFRRLRQILGPDELIFGLNGRSAHLDDLSDYDGRDCHNVYVDLTDRTALSRFFDTYDHIDLVFHLAGENGGIAYNQAAGADIFMKNTLMALDLLDCCAHSGVDRVVSIVASCAYQAKNGVCKEEEFFLGEPDITVAGHAHAKRNLQLASRFYHQQYGLEAICLCPTTIYGPGMDFHPARAKVMGGMIRRMVEARRANLPSVTVWGTGQAYRDFIYVDDCVDLILDAALVYDDCSLPLNLGFEQELTVRELAHLVARLANYGGKIFFDHSKPDGQHKKLLDITRMTYHLGEKTFIPLEEGIRRTIRWYEDNYQCVRHAS